MAKAAPAGPSAQQGAAIANVVTGANCTDPPPGANFYPIFTTTHNGPGACAWQEGGPFLPGTIDTFGGNAHSEYGGLFLRIRPGAHFTPSKLYLDFQRELGNSPGKA